MASGIFAILDDISAFVKTLAATLDDLPTQVAHTQESCRHCDRRYCGYAQICGRSRPSQRTLDYTNWNYSAD